MRAGRLRHRVTIQYGRTSRDAFGTELLTWLTLATVWADVRSVSGREQVQPDEQIFSNLPHQVTLRYLANVTAKMRSLWNGRVLEIQSVSEPDNRLRMIQLDCMEITVAVVITPPPGDYTAKLDFSDMRNSQYLQAMPVF